MPAQKKVWVFDGSIEQYPSGFQATLHGQIPCTTCHGGDDSASTRATAHSGDWSATPGAARCSSCHRDIVRASAKSLHVTLGGFAKALATRGADLSAGGEVLVRFEAQCGKCHLANEESEATCGFCHVSVPATAGGGFLNGHVFRKTPDMERNCTACHGSRVKDEFYGLNGALVARNGLGVAAPRPDVHFARTQEMNADGLAFGCTFCHSGAEMHGFGAPAPVGSGDRYEVSTAPKCETCHGALQASNILHSPKHLETLACQTCHAQAYKSCFGCHTDLDAATGLGFFKSNEGDPTRPARGATAAPDALVTFRIGRNPRADKPVKYAVLRHVPVDADVFDYPSAPLAGAIPTVTAAPTWKYASPHNIQKNDLVTPRTYPVFDSYVCSNCHGTGHAGVWLSDPIADAKGWLQAKYEAAEVSANADVVRPTPIPYGN